MRLVPFVLPFRVLVSAPLESVVAGISRVVSDVVMLLSAIVVSLVPEPTIEPELLRPAMLLMVLVVLLSAALLVQLAAVHVELLLPVVVLRVALPVPLAAVGLELQLSAVLLLVLVVLPSVVMLVPLTDGHAQLVRPVLLLGVAPPLPLANVEVRLLLPAVPLPVLLVLLVPPADVEGQRPCGNDPGGCPRRNLPAPSPRTARSDRGGQGEMPAGARGVRAAPEERRGTERGRGRQEEEREGEKGFRPPGSRTGVEAANWGAPRSGWRRAQAWGRIWPP